MTGGTPGIHRSTGVSAAASISTARSSARSSTTLLTCRPGLGSIMYKPQGEAHNDDVRSPSGSRRHRGVGVDAAVTIATPTPGTPLAQPCDASQWWDPTGKVCRPLGVGPQPLACEPSQWWDPTANVCRPLGVGPQPLACDNGEWWDPTANVCRPPLVPPAG